MSEHSSQSVIQFFSSSPTVRAIRAAAAAKNVRAFLSGGVVRDRFLNRDGAADWDVYVECSLEDARVLRTNYTELVKAKEFEGAASSAELDLIPSQDIELTVGFFDFSMNAIIFDCATNEIRDPFLGIPDILARRLRIMHLPFFLMTKPFFRFFRFAEELRFSYSEESLQQLTKYRGMIGLADPPNRARSMADLMRYLSAPSPASLKDLLRSRLLETFIPFLEPIGPGRTPEWDGASVLEHNFALVYELPRVLQELPQSISCLLQQVRYERSTQDETSFSSRMNLLAHIRLAALVEGSADGMLGLQPDLPKQFRTDKARAYHQKKLMSELASTMRADKRMADAILASANLTALSEDILELSENSRGIRETPGIMHQCAAVLAIGRIRAEQRRLGKGEDSRVSALLRYIGER